MNILFLHDHGSRPGGIEPTVLKVQGHEVVNPALPKENFAQSVSIAQRTFDRNQPDVVVGSARGGAVALNMDTGQVPLILIAPAWKTWGTATTAKASVTILHSEHDDVVPIGDSAELLRNSGLARDRLVVVGDDHRMVDEAAIGALLQAVENARKG
jgi:hypothetical protein